MSAVFMFEAAVRNSATRYEEQIWITSTHQIDSNPSCAIEDSERLATAGKHFRILFAYHAFNYKIGEIPISETHLT